MNWDDPTTAALLVADALDRAKRPYALYGGLLLAAYGEPRETRDVDLAVADLTTEDARRALAAAGIDTNTSFDYLRTGGLDVGRLVLLGAADDDGLCTLALVRPRSARYGVAALERAASAPLRDGRVRVLVPEDFVLFKALSTRDRDLDDAASVLRRSGAAIDAELIDREGASLATEIPDVDVLARLAAIRARASARSA